MYCRTCGIPLDPRATACSHCDSPKDSGRHYCSGCGRRTEPEDLTCPHCGCSLERASVSSQSRRVAGWLGIFLGTFGIHNFYLGKPGRGLCQLLIPVLSLGTLFFLSTLWGLAEGIGCLRGRRATDGDGLPLGE